jgi:trans-aconitate methyltransferase
MSARMNLDEQKHFYDERWKNYGFVNQAKLERCTAILSAMAGLKLNQPEIIELGCGSGWLTGILGAFGPATGVELSELAVAQAAERCPSARFLQADLARWEYPRERFDLVVSHEVLEHVEDQPRHLEVAHGLLRQGGCLILTTPNKPIFDHLAARGQVEMQPIEKWVDKSTLRRMVQTHFQVVRLTTIRPLPCSGLFRIINFFTVRALAERMRVKPLFERSVCAWGGGLHLFLVARKV